MSLREELYDYVLAVVQYHDRWGKRLDKDAEDYTYDIIKKVENRIDEMINSNLPKDILNSNLSISEKNDLLVYRMALNDVKAMLNDDNELKTKVGR